MFYIELHTEGNHMMSDTSKAPVPIANLRAESEASHLIQISKAIDDKHPISEIEVKSKEQSHMSLGNYTSAHPPKGFAIHISSDPEPDTIVTQITSLGTDKEYELVLHIANYGNKVISAEVWQI